jgi:3-hydroxyisobutyrate dehydrogenase
MSTLQKIGIVGTGRMGSNIAKRLNDVGYSIVALYDLNPESAHATAAETGGEVTASLPRVTALADVIITVVTDDAAMYEIFTPPEDSLLTNAAGKFFVNCATVSPQAHVEAEKLAKAAGADEKMSASLKYIGEAGRAAQVKALVNMVMNINTAGLAEGLGLGDALGIDLDMLREVFSQTGANSRVLETDGADMQNRDHDVYFSAAHAAKDSGIALALAQGAGLELPLAKATFEQYERMKALGLGELDKSGISELTFQSRRIRNGV